MLRRAFLTMSDSDTLHRIATGFAPVRRMTRRFVAGETLDDAMTIAEELNEDNLAVMLNYLGESVDNEADARAYADEHVRALDTMAERDIRGNISVKPTAMGINMDTALCYENVRRVAERARSLGRRLEIDMEHSSTTDATLDVYARLLDEGFDDLLLAVQAYLFRTEQDVETIIESGGALRLTKGAYDEPPSIAFPEKADVDANYVRLMKLMLSADARDAGFYAAIATHDENIIQATIEYADEQGVSKDAFEFQMLYGVRETRQRELADAGYTVRVYVPYGSHWYPYFMRRLAERPANAVFIVRNLF